MFKKFFSSITISLLSIGAFAQNIDWQYSYGGTDEDIPTSIAGTKDGGCIIAGSSSSKDGNITLPKGGADFWIVKLSSSGLLQWQVNLGGTSKFDNANAIIENSKGEYVIAGSSFSKDCDISEKQTKGGDDFWVVCLKPDGKLKWQMSYGGFKRDVANAIVEGKDGYLVIGSTESSDKDVVGNHGRTDVWALKIKDGGKKEWAVCLGGSGSDNAYSVANTDDGGFILAGETNSKDGDIAGSKGSYDFWVVKLDAAGKIAWQKCLGGTEEDVARSVIATIDGYVVVGETSSTQGDVKGMKGEFDYWVVKLDPSGNILWEKTFGGTSFDHATQVMENSAGDLLILGSTNSNDEDVKGSNIISTNGWLIKTDATGTIKWQKSFGGNNIDEAYAMDLTSDGNIVIAANSFSTDGNLSAEQNKGMGDYWILKMTDQ